MRVTRAAFGHIRSGNAARGRAAWRRAADAYRAALAEMPGLSHIWVQLAHAEKEAGESVAAIAAYKRAASMRPDDPEPHLMLGYMAKRSDLDRAARHFLAALRIAPDNLSAIAEIMQSLGRHRSDARFIDEALTLLGIDRAAVLLSETDRDLPEGTLFFDVTDLLSFFSFSRIPSGVQRVQIETMLAVLGERDRERISLCYYSPARQGWTTISSRTFSDLCAASLRDDTQRGQNWADDLRLVYIATALSDEIVFPHGAVLVSLGANSPNVNYLLDIRNICVRQGVVYVPVMYDLIPVLFPHWVVSAHALDFSAWLNSMLHTARGFIAISQATRVDLVTYAAQRGVTIDPALAVVWPLDGDSVKHDRERVALDTLQRWKLKPGRYVLFVSTIEPRKNHVAAFRAWEQLAREIGTDALPDFVCVGGRGWLNGEIHAAVAKSKLLRAKVRILSGISDPDLDLLYRECAFTLYPSFYEGWGLPVTESLSHGKVPAISTAASLPEAGGDHAVYFDPSDPAAIAAAIKPLILDPSARAAREARIRADYRPRPWSAIGAQLIAEARAIADRIRVIGEAIPTPPQDRRLSLAAPEGLDEGHSNGEVFRYGTGWSMPGIDGCVISGKDALLRFAAPRGGATLAIDVRGLDSAVGYAIRGGVVDVVGGLAPDERRRLSLQIVGGSTEVAIDATGSLIVEAFSLSG